MHVYNCALLNDAYWGLWALNLLTPETYAKEGIFNYDMVKCRLQMYNKVLKDRQKLLN